MINKEQQQFFALLRAGLWNTPADLTLFSGCTDWETIFVHATRQTVSGLVATGIGMLPAVAQPQASVMNRLRNVVTATIRSHALINRTLAEAVTVFAQNGIRPVLLKGQGVAANYIEPCLRMCGDIDLYVGLHDYNKACEIAGQWGGSEDEAMETQKHYHFKHGEVTLELHYIAEQLPQLRYNTRFQDWTNRHLYHGCLRSIEIEGVTISVPPVNFDALYIFNHAWHHFSEGGGIGLRQLCDWVRYLHTFRKEINRVELERDLKAFGLWHPWRMFAPIAVQTLGLPPEEFPFYTNRYAYQARRIVSMITKEGNFGFFDSVRTQRPQGYIAGKMHTLTWMSRRHARLLTLCPQKTVAAWTCYLCTGIKRAITDTLNRPD